MARLVPHDLAEVWWLNFYVQHRVDTHFALMFEWTKVMGMKKASLKKNPLKNLNVMLKFIPNVRIKFNPYAKLKRVPRWLYPYPDQSVDLVLVKTNLLSQLVCEINLLS